MTDKSCPECGQIFPLRLGEGICAKCVKINVEAVGTTGRAEAEAFHQCHRCGVSRKRGMSTIAVDSDERVCGSAECIAYTPSSANGTETTPHTLSVQVRETQYAQAIRTDQLRQRMKFQSAQNAPNVQIQTLSGSSLNTAALQTLQSNTSGPFSAPEPQCLIGYQVRVDGKINTLLGAGVKPYPLASFLGDVKVEIVKQINAEWTRSGRAAVLLDEVAFRWSGNRSLDENTTTLTLRDFFQYYNLRSNVNTAIGLQNVPLIFKNAVKNHKTMPMAFFDMLIYYAEYKERIATASSGVDDYSPSAFLQNALRSVAKRPRNTSSAAIDSARAVKHRNTSLAPSSQFTSMFRPSTRQERVTLQSASNVTLSKVIAISEGNTGEPSLLTTNSEIDGLLSDKSMAHGSMKVVFEFIVPGLERRFVAKRFFRSEAGDEEEEDFSGIDLLYVAPEMHLALIEDEVLRLAEVSWFLKEFQQFCRKEYPGVAVEKKIQIADAYIGTEKNILASLASGLPRQHSGPGMSWLIEEKRALSITKFSGTLQHNGSRQDPMSATIYAFSHFVLWHSKETRVIADLQGTLTNVNGIDTMMLFDIMCHTSDGQSGVGDFGQQGIESFITTHSCSSVCKAVQLDKVRPLVAEGSNRVRKQVIDNKEEGEVSSESE